MLFKTSVKAPVLQGAKLMTACKSLIAIADYVYGAVYIILMNDRGLSTMEISTVFSVATMMLFLFDFPTGAISDKFGRKKIAGIGIIVWGTSFFLFLISYTLLGFLISEAFLQLGIALVSGNFQTWFFDLTEKYDEKEYRDEILMKIGIIVQIFSIVGSLLGSMILLVGIKFLYIFCGATMIVMGILCVLIGEDNHSSNSENKKIIEHFLSVTREFVQSRLSRKLIPFTFFVSFSTYAFILGWQLYFLKVLKLPEHYVGILLVVFMFALLIGRNISMFLKNKKQSFETIIVCGLCAMGVGFLILFFIKHIVFFIFGAILIEAGLGLYYSAQEIWLLSIIPSQNKASFFSGIKTFEEIFIFVLSLCIGAIAQWIGIRYLWLIAALSMILGILYFENVFCTIKEK